MSGPKRRIMKKFLRGLLALLESTGRDLERGYELERKRRDGCCCGGRCRLKRAADD